MKELHDFCAIAIQQRFGDLGHAIVKALNRRNGQDIPSLAKMTGLEIELIARGITSLVQHDIIRIGLPRTYPKPSMTNLASERRAIAKRRKATRSDPLDSDPEDSDDDDEDDGQGFSYGTTAFAHPSALFGDPAGGVPPSHVLMRMRKSIIHHPIHSRSPVGHTVGAEVGAARHVSGKYVYFLDLNMALGLTRYSEYLTIARRLFGRETHALLEEFTVRGKLTLSQAISAAYIRLEAEIDEVERQKADGTYVAQDRSHQGILMKNMLQRKIVTMEMVDDLGSLSLQDLASLPPEILEAYNSGLPITAELVAQANASTLDQNERESLPERLRMAFERLLSSGFLVPSTNFFNRDEAKLKRRILETTPSEANSKKRRVGMDESVASPSNSNSSLNELNDLAQSTSSAGSTNTPYIINHDRFTLLNRNDMIVEYARRRLVEKTNVNGTEPTPAMNTKPAMITQVMLYALDSTNNKQMFNPEDVLVMVREHFGSEIDFSLEDVKFYMEEMASPNVAMLAKRTSTWSRTEETAPEYMFLMEAVMQMVRIEHAQSIVSERCGTIAGRLFRLLSEKKRLEEKSISDFGLIPKKECKEVLYSMLKAQFVELQEIPRTADRQPSRAFFTWSIPHSLLTNTILSYLYKSWSFISCRLQYETSLVQELLDKGNAAIQFEDDEQAQVERWAIIFAKSELAMRGISKMILLFRDLSP